MALARAFAYAPALILADKPTGNLDADNSRVVIDMLLRARAERGMAIVIVTHEAAVAARADRTIRLKDGVVVAPPLEARDETATPRADG